MGIVQMLTPGRTGMNPERIIGRHVPQAKRSIIESIFAKVGTSRLKSVVDAASGRISYDEARLVRAAM